ncbi:MAG: GNAT family N-acetyltransferase [Thalassobaculales bacterium]
MDGASARSKLPPVPADLASRDIGIREEAPADRPFLSRLYASVRWEELAPTGWSASMRANFLAQQFELQDRHYKVHYAGAAFGIITERTVPIGRLYLHQGEADLRIMDIALMPTHRGLGIGGAFLQAVLQMGWAAGTAVSIHVEAFNHRARALYERLGFAEAAQVGLYHRLEWHPPAGQQRLVS